MPRRLANLSATVVLNRLSVSPAWQAEDMDLSDQRVSYEVDGLRVDDLHDDPFEQFRLWFDDATSAGVNEPYAMVLSTVDVRGRPRGRNVLLRAVDHGFVFYTNYGSAKAKALESSGFAGLTFSWLLQHRQVHVEGAVERVGEDESDEYFSKRPRDSQLGAWASEQSTPIGDRQELERRLEQVADRFEGTLVSRPPFWGGYRVIPDQIEFWQGQPNRLHNRVRYERGLQFWTQTQLSP